MVNHCQLGTCKPNHSVKFDSKGNLRRLLTRLFFKVSLHVQISSMWWKLRSAILIHTKYYATQLQFEKSDMLASISATMLYMRRRKLGKSQNSPICSYWSLNTLRPKQNGRHFADDTFNRIFVNENVRILIKFSLKFVPKGPINNIPALVQIMAWRRPGDKPLSEPVMVSLLTHICVTRSQWVNTLKPNKAICSRHFQIHFLYEQFCILLQVSEQNYARGQIGYKPTLVQILAWPQVSDKPLCEPEATEYTDACMSQSAWVGWLNNSIHIRYLERKSWNVTKLSITDTD